MDQLVAKRNELPTQLEELQEAENALKPANADGEEEIPARSDSLSPGNEIPDTPASTSMPTGINIDSSEMLALPASGARRLSQQDLEVLTMDVPSKRSSDTPAQPLIVDKSSSFSSSASSVAAPPAASNELGPQSPSEPPQSPLSPAIDRLLKSAKERKVSTVWDEDDIEALQIARTLAAHASALFPNQKREVGVNETERSIVNTVTAAATKTSGVRSRIAAFETWSGGVPDGARSIASTVSVKPGGYIETVHSSSKLSVVNTSLPSSVIKGPSATEDDKSLAKLNARQSSLLRKALTKIQSLGADLSNEDDFKALAVTIVNSGSQIVNTGANLATAASNKISEFLSKELDDEEAENELINSYFIGARSRASVSFAQHISSASPAELPATLVARHNRGIDIHDKPTGFHDEDEVDTHGEGFYRTPTAKSTRGRRQTMRAVDDLSKRASLLPTNDLLRRLNTVMADIQEFDLLDRDVGVVVAEDTDYMDIDRIVHASLNDGSDFEVEPRDENSTFSMMESENGDSGSDHATGDPGLSADTTGPRHPAHLVKHLDRMSLYTASYVPSEGVFQDDEETSGGIDLLSMDGMRSLSVGSPAIPRKPPITHAVERVMTQSNSFEGSTLANSTNALPSQASSPAFRSRTPTVNNSIPVHFSALESYYSLPLRATSPLVPSSLTPRALSPTPTIPRPSSPNFLSPRPSHPLGHRPISPTVMNPPHSRSVSSPTPHHYTMSTLSAPVMLNNHSIGTAKASLLNSEDDPDAISGQVKLHTNRLFRAWQDTILVLSPRKRGLYYVKTGGGLTSSEQVVGFLELNSHTVAESISKEKGMANVFKGKPTFRVCQVLETGSGAVNRKYFYFMAASNEDRDMWVDALQSFLTTLQKQSRGQESSYGDINNPSLFTRAQSIRSVSSNQLSPEELQVHLLKQQKLLAQQRALMAAVAAQVQFQEEITSELQYAQHHNQYFSYPRPGTSTSSYGVVNGGSPEPIAYVSDSYQRNRRPSDLLPPAMMRGGTRGDSSSGSKKSGRVRDPFMFREKRISGSMGSGSDKTSHPPGRTVDRGSSTGYEFGTSLLKVVDETGISPSPIPPGPVTLSRTRTAVREGAASPGLFSSWFGRIRSKDSRFD